MSSANLFVDSTGRSGGNMRFKNIARRALLASLTLCPIILNASAETVEVRLNNDAKYNAAYETLLSNPPKSDVGQGDLLKYTCDLALAANRMRDYVKAEKHSRDAITINPNLGALHTNLSVCLGKQGKYEEAIKEARYGKLLDPRVGMHAELVICSWEWRLGQKEQAMKRFQAIDKPSDPYLLALYYGCKACFYCDVGDEGIIKDSLLKALDMDKTNQFKSLFERDIMFDPYRAKPWFIGIFGETLEKSK